MILALHTYSSDLAFLKSKRRLSISQGNMGISVYEAHQICHPLVLNTAGIDSSHWDADGLRAKAMQNHRPNCLTAGTTPQKFIQLTVKRKTPLISDVNGSRASWDSSLPIREWSWALPKTARSVHEVVEGSRVLCCQLLPYKPTGGHCNLWFSWSGKMTESRWLACMCIILQKNYIWRSKEQILSILDHSPIPAVTM